LTATLFGAHVPNSGRVCAFSRWGVALSNMKIVSMVDAAATREAAERAADVEAVLRVIEDVQTDLRAALKALTKATEDHLTQHNRQLVELRQRVSKLEGGIPAK
jgi:hypothetical protein